MYRKVFKRVLDFLFSLTALALLSPILILVSLLLLVVNRGKPFFIQARPGKNEELFRIVKFKTMNDGKDANGMLRNDAERLTRVGAFVRKTSLDELPQLYNVLVGDMSLIGPRPLLIKYLPYYTDTERKRHSVRPGITGLAQVNGRNILSWDKRLALDVLYVEELSFKTDMEIVIKTIKHIFAAKDIVVNPESIMQNFDDERSR